MHIHHHRFNPTRQCGGKPPRFVLGKDEDAAARRRLVVVATDRTRQLSRSLCEDNAQLRVGGTVEQRRDVRHVLPAVLDAAEPPSLRQRMDPEEPGLARGDEVEGVILQICTSALNTSVKDSAISPRGFAARTVVPTIDAGGAPAWAMTSPRTIRGGAVATSRFSTLRSTTTSTDADSSGLPLRMAPADPTRPAGRFPVERRRNETGRPPRGSMAGPVDRSVVLVRARPATRRPAHRVRSTRAPTL